MPHHMLNVPHKFLANSTEPGCLTCGGSFDDPIHSSIHTTMPIKSNPYKPHTFVPQKPPKGEYCALCNQHKNDPGPHPLRTPITGTEPHTLVSDDVPYSQAQRGVPLHSERELTMLDLNGNEIVEVQISTNPAGGETLWVNVDGICRLRAVRPGQIVINDERKPK